MLVRFQPHRQPHKGWFYYYFYVILLKLNARMTSQWRSYTLLHKAAGSYLSEVKEKRSGTVLQDDVWCNPT